MALYGAVSSKSGRTLRATGPIELGDAAARVDDVMVDVKPSTGSGFRDASSYLDSFFDIPTVVFHLRLIVTEHIMFKRTIWFTIVFSEPAFFTLTTRELTLHSYESIKAVTTAVTCI